MTPSDILKIKDSAHRVGFEISVLNEDAFEATYSKNDLSFKVTVAHSVLEWFTEIEDAQTKLKYSSWFDYLGYGNTEHDQLVSEMVRDLESSFFEISQNIFRVKRDNICQKKVEDKWVYCSL